MKKKLLCAGMILLCVLLCTGCGKKATLNGVNISEYTIVYDAVGPDYNRRAAQYIHDEIQTRTGADVPMHDVDEGKWEHEIVVGETSREISGKLDAQTQNMEFSMLSDGTHIALEGDYFIVAAAAYYFVDTYIPGDSFESQLPQEVTVCQPITEKANNFFFLIGDGMGPVQTRIPDYYDLAAFSSETDGEDIFYGYYLPYQGVLHTNSKSGLTDSAAGGTALATGYKTLNGYVGKNSDGDDVQSLTELAASLGKATAVMSTDLMTGATPASFSAHAWNRDKTNEILETQQKLMENGTIITCNLHSSRTYEQIVSDTLTQLEQGSENGFFLMYEEAYIDKYCHQNDIINTTSALARFNQVIGIMMEYIFYHPDSMLLITADHETGGLAPNDRGLLSYSTDYHTNADVPIFAYGQGAEVFADYSEENNEVPKVIAGLWGVESFGG